MTHGRRQKRIGSRPRYRDLVLIKWIECGVTDPASFAHGQRAWNGLSGFPGFLGQGGGWSRHTRGLAHVFGCWTDRSSYETFMAERHDRLATDQAGTYHSIEVRLFEHRMDIGERFPADFVGASLLRLAHCRVKVDHQTRFIEAQAEVWNPGMTRAPGMRRGVFAQRGETEFLVLSLWDSVPDHERYLNEHFPSQRQQSGATDHLDGITGDVIDLDAAWTVPAER